MSSAVRTTEIVKAKYDREKHGTQNDNYRDAQDNCSSRIEWWLCCSIQAPA